MLNRTRSLVLSGLLGLFVSVVMYAQPAIDVDAQRRMFQPSNDTETTAAVNGAGSETETTSDTQQENAETDTPAPVSGVDGETEGTPNTQQENSGIDMPLTLQTQEPAQVNSLAELDAENQKLSNWIRQGLGSLPNGARIRLGPFLMNGEEPTLGIYWRNQLSSILSSMQHRNFVIITDTTSQGDYALSGEIMRIGNVLRLYTRLVKYDDTSLITTWIVDLLVTPFIEELIGISGGGSGSAASGVSRDRYETDSRENPLSAAIGSPEISRTLHDGDEDWFSIYIETNGTLILETTGSMDTYMELYDGSSHSSSRLASNDDGGNNLNARIEYFVEAGKTYIAKVRGLGGDTGAYGFNIMFNAMPVDPAEPNDTQEQSTPIELEIPLEASFHSSTDEDWYSLDIPEDGGFLTVYTEGRLDTRVTLYDTEGTVLADDDDSGSGLNARVSVQTASGTVYIRVREIDGDRGSYTLYTQLREPGHSDEFEPDNTPETAGALETGVLQERTLTSAEDEDWVMFTVTEAGLYDIRTIAADQRLDTYIELYDENKEYLTDDDDSGENYDAYLQVQLEPGTYFIVIRTLDDDPLDNNAYTLSVAASDSGEGEM
jgi:hypothetical protein